MSYELIEHTADLGIRVTAEDLPGLFREAGLALVDILGARCPEGQNSVEVSAAGLDRVDLLVRWLQELLYLVTVKGLRLHGITVQDLGEEQMKAVVQGAFGNTPLEKEIKAVTYHGLDIVQSGSGYEAAIIFDI
jgi:SHS2 domain-containing protein